MYTYEVGQGLQPGATSHALMEQAQTDPRMADAYREFVNIWEIQAGGLSMHYALARPPNPFGFYELLHDIKDLGSLKWDTMMDILLDRGDANLDGMVGPSDLAIWETNFGAMGLFWEQANFDADGDVDGAEFMAWQRNFSDGAAASVAIAPEPAAWVLQVLTLTALVSLGRNFGLQGSRGKYSAN